MVISHQEMKKKDRAADIYTNIDNSNGKMQRHKKRTCDENNQTLSVVSSQQCENVWDNAVEFSACLGFPKGR